MNLSSSIIAHEDGTQTHTQQHTGAKNVTKGRGDGTVKVGYMSRMMGRGGGSANAKESTKPTNTTNTTNTANATNASDKEKDKKNCVVS